MSKPLMFNQAPSMNNLVNEINNQDNLDNPPPADGYKSCGNVQIYNNI